MKKIILYIAVSLDGYIADNQGSVEWIKGDDDTVELEDTFSPFFSSVDTVVMGRKTFDQIVSSLSCGQWPYTGTTTYVLTHHNETNDTEQIRFKNMDVCQLVEELRQGVGKNIWICGGAEIAGRLVGKNMIDTYHLAVIPVILGSGVRLFGSSAPKIRLTLVETKKYNGIVEVIYDVANSDVIIRNMNKDDIEPVMQIWLATNVQAHDFITETYWKGQFENVKKTNPCIRGICL